MRSMEQRLTEYKENRQSLQPREEHIERTVRSSVLSFAQSGRLQRMDFFEFLFRQAAYIRKRWWILQILVLAVLWGILHMEHSSFYVRRSMGVLAPVFSILVIPELWKNRSFGAMEVESAAYFSLRQIYAARMLLFAMADILILSIFFVLASATLHYTALEMLIHFFLPMGVTCCINVGTLCQRRWGSETFALGMCLVWAAVWNLIILKESVYAMISGPVWAAALCGTAVYLILAVRRILKECNKHWEAESLWN